MRPREKNPGVFTPGMYVTAYNTQIFKLSLTWGTLYLTWDGYTLLDLGCTLKVTPGHYARGLIKVYFAVCLLVLCCFTLLPL